MRTSAVIFDLDGVLIDTERLAFTAWQRKLSEMGFSLEESDYRVMIGLDADQTVSYVQVKTGIVSDPTTLLADHEKMMLAILDREIEPLPGATDLVWELHDRGYPLGIASNSSLDYVARALKGLGLEGAFTAIISREQVRNGKPAPDIYLAACAALGESPLQCLAVEDSIVGVKSAAAAGVRCIAIPAPGIPKEEFRVAYAIFESLPALRASLDAVLL